MSNTKFEVICDNAKSYSVCLVKENGRFLDSMKNCGKPVLLVKCNRLDHDDNERGRLLATKIAEFLNTLSEDELPTLMASDKFPRGM